MKQENAATGDPPSFLPRKQLAAFHAGVAIFGLVLVFSVSPADADADARLGIIVSSVLLLLLSPLIWRGQAWAAVGALVVYLLDKGLALAESLGSGRVPILGTLLALLCIYLTIKMIQSKRRRAEICKLSD